MRIYLLSSSAGKTLVLCLLLRNILLIVAEAKDGNYKDDGYKDDGYKDDGYKDDGYKDDGGKADGYKDDGYKDDGGKADGYKDDGYKDDGGKADGYKIEDYKDGGYKTGAYRDEAYQDDGEKDEGYKDEGHKNDGYKNDGYKDDGNRGDGYNDDDKYKRVEVTEGQTATLKCPLKPDSSDTIIWKTARGEMLYYGDRSITDNRRIKSYNDLLQIYNVTKYDENTYTCSLRSGAYYSIRLSVTELQCYNVSHLTHGYVVYYPHPRLGQKYHKYGTKVLYFCNRGYSLLGTEVRYCNHPERGWTGDEPSCENPFVVNLEYRIKALEKLYENNILTYGGMAERVTAAEDESRHQFTLLEYLLHDLTTFRLKTQEQQEKMNVELRSLRLAVLQQRYQQQRLMTPNHNDGVPVFYGDGMHFDREQR